MQGKREEQAARRREILLETAFRMFSERGYRKTAVRSITRDAGVTEAVLYHYFTNKADLLAAVIQRYAPFARFREIIDEQGDAPFDDVLRVLSREFSRLLLERRAFILGLLSEAPNDPDVAAILERFLRETVQHVSQFLRNRQLAGEINPDIDVLATAHVLQGGLIIRFLSHALTDVAPSSGSDLVTTDGLVDVLLAGIAVKSDMR
jgi:AcrR family transcriptional regulator